MRAGAAATGWRSVAGGCWAGWWRERAWFSRVAGKARGRSANGGRRGANGGRGRASEETREAVGDGLGRTGSRSRSNRAKRSRRTSSGSSSETAGIQRVGCEPYSDSVPLLRTRGKSGLVAGMGRSAPRGLPVRIPWATLRQGWSRSVKPMSTPAGSGDFGTGRRARASTSASGDCRSATPATFGRLARVSRNCVATTGRATGCISCGVGGRW